VGITDYPSRIYIAKLSNHRTIKTVTVSLPSTPSFRLDGRTALVTGASRGIGLGAAVALAEAGAEVTLAARSVDDLAAAASAINERCKKLSAVNPEHKGSASALARGGVTAGA